MYCPADKHEMEHIDDVGGMRVFRCHKCGREWGIKEATSHSDWRHSPLEPSDEAEYCHECDDFTVIGGVCRECGELYEDRFGGI